VIGGILPASGNAPQCDELRTVCRRICGSLPAGKKPGGIVKEEISPSGYSKFVDPFEIYPMHGNYYRVCRRVKNWGDSRRFTIYVSYSDSVAEVRQRESKAATKESKLD
jgi:hypothetical protein